MAFVFKFDEKAQEQLNIFGARKRLTEKYVANCKGVKGTWQERNKALQELRKEYIKSYLEISPDVVDLNLINFADTLFYEFDRPRCDGKTLSNAIQKNISKIDALEVSSGKKRTYLDLTYQEEEGSYVRIPQSIADYRKYGAQFERTYNTVTKEYNPEYIAKHLPKELKLKKDDNGYYLTQQECTITNDDLKKMNSRYDKKLELEQF